MINVKSVEEFIFHSVTPQDETVDSEFARIEKVGSYSLASPHRVSSGGGDGVFIASSKAFLVMTTFQSAGLVVGERVPSVRTLVNSSFTMMTVLYSAPRCLVGLRLDSTSLVEVHWSPVEMSGVQSLSGHCLVKVCSSQKMTRIACPARLWWTLTRQ
jgi:hypothetical protein